MSSSSASYLQPLPKNASNTAQQASSASQSQAQSPVSCGDRQRRAAASGVPGNAPSSRPAAPRNSQALRKQHKMRRPRLTHEDQAVERAAINSTSSRKGQTSITHLMNFTLPPRPQNQSRPFRPNSRRSPAWAPPIDKARYIHANYRFIVNPKATFKFTSVDDHLEWGDIMQILASAQSQSTSCPICLSTPIAPRMAKCGHIFCLPCLIRYMHSSDEVKHVPEKKSRWKKCPICWDIVYMNDGKPVRWFVGQEGSPPRDGEDVVLRLMSRRPQDIQALPRDYVEAIQDEIPWYFAAEVLDYARIMKGSESYMRSFYEREIEEIKLQESEDELMFGEETRWTKRAVASVEEAMERVKGIGDPPPSAMEKKPDKHPTDRLPIKYHKSVPDFYLIQQASKSGRSSDYRIELSPTRDAASVEQEASTESDSETSPSFSSQPQIHQTHTSPNTRPNLPLRKHNEHFHFYQALPHYYLAPLDIRILKAAFGNYSSFPTTILPRVEKVSTGHIVDDNLRRRAKYLSHLPQGCEVGFLECDWTDVVSTKTLALFQTELERRRKKNREKEAREDKERLRAEAEEDEKRWAAARRKRPSFSTEVKKIEEAFNQSDEYDLFNETTFDEAARGMAAASPPWPRRTGSAFATLASPSTSPNSRRTVWGTNAVPINTNHYDEASQPEAEPSEKDNWIQGWDFDPNEGLATQLNTSSIKEEVATEPSSSQGNKKKKSKKITLMSTSARRAA